MADSTIDVMTDLTPQVASTIVNLAIEMMIISEAQYPTLWTYQHDSLVCTINEYGAYIYILISSIEAGQYCQLS